MKRTQLAGLILELTLRYEYTKDGQSVDIIGPLFSDTFQQPYLLLNGVPVMVKLTPSPNTFRLMTNSSLFKHRATK